MLAWAVVASACASPSASSPVPVEERVTGRRDLEALQRLAQHPRACTEDASCPIGSHCDPDSDTCRWACLADSECGTGRRCSLRGSCVAAGRARLANDTAGCEAIPAADRRAALIALDDDAQQGSFITCDSDETCPCGSHCSEDAVCQVACLSDQPTPGLTCGVGLACTALGRCATAATDPGPPLALTLSLSESITTANTAAAPVVMPLTITVDAIGLDVLTATTGASVKLTIAEVRDFDQGRAAAAPKLAPRVKCAAGDPLASSCEIAGGWTFVVSSGRLRSAPHQIWVEIPQSTTAQDWTLEARSEWAADPARDVVRAAPVIIPATDPGHYKGTMLVPNEGAATVADQTLVLPIEAIVTPTHVVVLEPTRLILPDGQVVFSRAETKSTLLAWLTTTGASYDVSLHLADFSYSAADGHLDASIELATGAATPVTTLYLALERSGDVDAPACPCTAGFYCHAALARCLPGSAPPAGGGIVDTVSALPSSALPSAKLAPWVAPLASAVAGASALLGGAETAGIERAYCFEAITQPGAAHLGVTLQSVSGDLSCMQGGASTTEYAQTTFAFENLDRELDPGTAGGDAFDLFETCVGDLTAQPTGPATASNLLGSKACTSLGRFFLAITANASGGVGQALPDTGQRLVDHVLRQWLGVHAYVASTAVQTRRYDDALSISSAPAQEQLGSAVDLVDAGLRVLLDPRVRPQYATGAGLQLAMTEPDYRLALRPVARWTFNGLA
ncbi:MAG: hypothetical protein ABIY55_26630, partial [Kofleriaceae bacterium]